ncbi:MAG: ABC-2 transporter permease [Nibricoccus sp.]
MSTTTNIAIQPNSPTPTWARAFGGVWRLTYLRYLTPNYLMVVGGLLAALGLLVYSALHTSNPQRLERGFAEWSVHFYLTMVVPIISFLTAAGLIQDDAKPSTVDYVLTRPIRRYFFVLYRYASLLMCMQVQFLIAIVVLVAVGGARSVPDLADSAPSLIAAQLFAVTAFTAMGFAFGSITSRYVVLGLVYGAIIEIGIGNIPTQLSRLSMLHHVRTVASSVLPFRGRAALAVDSLPTAIGSLLVFSVVCVALAAVLFALRETAGTKPKDV